MSHLLFVYGTLKQGYPNHNDWMAYAEFVDASLTCEPYPLVLNGARYSPVLVDAEGHGHRVHGELYRVDETLLDELDRLERVNDRDGYRRRRIAVVDTGGHPVAAWSYLKAPAWVDDVRSEPLANYVDDRYRSRD